MPELGWETFSPDEKAALLHGMASGETTLPPRTLQIDWTDRCNIDCFFCSQATMRRAGGELPVQVLEKCFAEMDLLGVRTLNVSGGGDPLFHRHILSVLEAIRPHHFRIGTVTTNAVLAREQVAELLIETTREQITVSLNSLGAADYARVMRTSSRNYDRVLDNIRLLVAIKRRRAAGTRIAVQFLVHDETHRQLPRMFALAEDLGVDRVSFSPLHFFNDRSRQILEDAEAFLSDVAAVLDSDLRGIIADLRTIHPELHAKIARLRFSRAAGRYPVNELQQRNYGALQSFCSLPWFNLHVKANGDVYPCCALLTPDFAPFGNVCDASIREIWEGDAFRRFRTLHSGFTRAKREGDEPALQSSELPKPCTVQGMCFLKALPYLDDTPFAVAVDGLSRCYPQNEVQFPDRMRDGEWATLSGVDSSAVEVRVNRVHCGDVDRDGSDFSFRFRPEPLTPGFHLLEIRDKTGRVLAARMVEKI